LVNPGPDGCGAGKLGTHLTRMCLMYIFRGSHHIDQSGETMRTRSKFFGATAVVAGLLLGACGGSSDDTSSDGTAATTDEAADTSESDESPALTGNLIWWTNLSLEQTEAMIGAFNEVHPGITVEYSRQDDAEGFEKFTTAMATDTVGPDVMQIGWDGFSKGWAEEGYLLEYVSPEGESIPAEIKGANGEYYTYGNLLEGICYNSDRLDELGLDAPAEWEDLADPQYFGEITMQDPLKVGSGAHNLMIETRVYWDDDERWEAFWEGYGANETNIQIGYVEAQQQLIQGNYAILGLCYLDYIQPTIDQGAPIVWLPVDPVVTVPFTIQIPTNAPNEENAKAFIDWMLSVEGQDAVANIAGQVPSRPGAPFPEPAKVAEGFPQVPALGTAPSVEEYENNSDYYVELAKEWFNLR